MDAEARAIHDAQAEFCNWPDRKSDQYDRLPQKLKDMYMAMAAAANHSLRTQLASAERDAARLTRNLAEMERERDALRMFWQAFFSDEWTTDIEAEKLYEAAVRAGLMAHEPYDPAVHPENEEFELGDMIYATTPLGRAALATKNA